MITSCSYNTKVTYTLLEWYMFIYNKYVCYTFTFTYSELKFNVRLMKWFTQEWSK